MLMAMSSALDVRGAPKLDAELVGIDKLATRWARLAHGHAPKLHPLELMRMLKDGAVFGGHAAPLPDDVCAFDQCFASSHAACRAIIGAWYLTGGSSKQKAERLGISRSQLYIEWRSTLSYFRGWIRARGIDI